MFDGGGLRSLAGRSGYFSMLLFVHHPCLVDEPGRCHPIALQWWRECGFGTLGDEVDLHIFMSRPIRERGSRYLAGQLVAQIGHLVDVSIMRSLHGKGAGHGVALTASFVSVLDCIEDPLALGSCLLRHVDGGVRHSREHNTVTLINDKASVCGLTLDAGALVWPSNRCAIAVTQVRPSNF